MNSKTVSDRLLLLAVLLPLGAVADVSAPGRLEGREQTQALSFAEAGTILSISVVDGQKVSRDQVLARLDCGPLDAEVKRAEAAVAIARRGGRREAVAAAEAVVAGAEKELELARARVRRLESVVARDLASKGDLEDARLLVGVAESGLVAARELLAAERNPAPPEEMAEVTAQLAAARARAARCVILAPADGIVLRRHLEPGMAVSILAPEPVLSFASTAQWRVRAEVDEDDVVGVHSGQAVSVTAPAFGSRTLHGKVLRLSPLMGRRRVLSDDPGEKLDRDVMEVLIALTESPPVPAIGLRVRVIFRDDGPAR
jgi:multidrug resistance efflux pump